MDSQAPAGGEQIASSQAEYLDMASRVLREAKTGCGAALSSPHRSGEP
jgi:hypothetical protein